MRVDTPLEEVAAHLPIQAAEMLLRIDFEFQKKVLAQVRIIVTYWEDRGVMLDPISYDVVLTSIVALGLADQLAER